MLLQEKNWENKLPMKTLKESEDTWIESNFEFNSVSLEFRNPRERRIGDKICNLR